MDRLDNKFVWALVIGVGLIVLMININQSAEESEQVDWQYVERTRPRADGTVAWVKVPLCSNGWSNEVPMVPGRSVLWKFSATRHERVNGTWKVPRKVPTGASVEALRFCATYGTGVRWWRLYWDGEDGYNGRKKVKRKVKPKTPSASVERKSKSQGLLGSKERAANLRKYRKEQAAREKKLKAERDAHAEAYRRQRMKRRQQEKEVAIEAQRRLEEEERQQVRALSKALPKTDPSAAVSTRKEEKKSPPPLKYELDNYGYGGNFPPAGVPCTAYGLWEKPMFFNGKLRVACEGKRKETKNGLPPLIYELDNYGSGGKYPPPGVPCSAYDLWDRVTIFNGKRRIACGN